MQQGRLLRPPPAHHNNGIIYATATALLLATAASNFPQITGQPTEYDIFNMTKVLNPILHNLKYNKFMVAGVNNHNLIGLIQHDATYTVASGAQFPRPVNPGPYNTTIPDVATLVVRNRRKAAHMVLANDFNTFELRRTESSLSSTPPWTKHGTNPFATQSHSTTTSGHMK